MYVYVIHKIEKIHRIEWIYNSKPLNSVYICNITASSASNMIYFKGYQANDKSHINYLSNLHLWLSTKRFLMADVRIISFYP